LQVDHGGGVTTRYYHLASFSVGQGAWVDQNTQIGVMGTTGYTDPCPTYHLHFEKRVNGTNVDPGPLKACSGSSLLSFPSAVGYASWDSIPRESRTVSSSGTGCAGGADGSFIRAPDGKVYRIAGGAPIYVSSWDSFGGPQPVTDVSLAQLNALRAVPADGTFISTNQDGSVYRIAGGAPIYVSTWNTYGGPQPTVGIDKWAVDNITNPAAHMRAVPADGTFINTNQNGAVYRIAGGAPLYISSWDIFGGVQPFVGIDKWAVDNITNPAAHMRAVPADGTLLRGLPSGRLWRIDNGRRSATTTAAGAVSVNDATAESFPLTTCPAGQTGTPPNCQPPPAACPAGQTGTPPNCQPPPAACPAGQTGTPPNCEPPPLACPAGQMGTPPNCTVLLTSGDGGQQPTTPSTTASTAPTTSTGQSLPPRIIRRTVKLRSGCSTKRLRVSGTGVNISFAKRLPRSRCRLTLRVLPGATGRRNLLVKSGRSTTALRGAIRL